MKKHLFFAAVAALALSGCASEEFNGPAVEPAVDGQVPMGFAVQSKNMNRAGLQTEFAQFGVYAVKANNQADIATYVGTGNAFPAQGAQTVMNDYLVGFWGDSEGYAPAKEQNLFTTNWYYEKLGSDDAGYTWTAGATYPHFVEMESSQDNQYLKYWDLSKTNTYFYAYAPYNQNVTMSVNADGKTVMTFPAYTLSTAATAPSYLYANKVCVNADYAKTDAYDPANNPHVTFTFNHLFSKMRIAFYHTIEGYDVELIDFKAADDGVKFLSSKKTGSAYSTSTFLNSCTPTIVFDEGNATLPDALATGTGTEIQWALGSFSNNHKLEYGYEKPYVCASAFADVIPQTNTGFTLNVSFKLTAKDTKEVIEVHGAKVFIAADYATWAANKAYTYVFRITNKVPGTTGTTLPDFGVEPSDPALFPIIFENLEVNSIEDVEWEWDVNDYDNPAETETPHTPSNHAD